MGEARLYDLSQQLRLLARATIALDRNGRVLSGGVDPQIEGLRMELLVVLEHLQDHRFLPPSGAEVVAKATALAFEGRHTLQVLRREVEAQAAAEAAVPRRFIAA